MVGQQDLTNPVLPDVGIPRTIDVDEYGWPEAGPSSSKRQPRIGPFGAKAVAAMTGAVATSLLMTPFDVLKTRLQTVQPSPRIPYVPPSQECCQTSVLTPRFSATPNIQGTSDPLSPSTCLTSASASSKSTVRSHLEAQASPSFFRSISATASAPPPSGCLHPSKWAGIWGEAVTIDQALARGTVRIGPGGGATLVLPAEHGVTGVIGGFWSEFAAVRRETGTRGLWKGVGTTLTMAIPSAAIYMIGYEHLLELCSPYFTGSTDPNINASSLHRRASNGVNASLTPAPLIAGSLARTISASIISPIEMFRTRLQSLPTVERGTPTYASTAKDMGRLVKSNGPTILWRGLGPTLWRDVPFSGLYWAGFELLKSRLSNSTTTLSPISTSLIAGAVSGTFAALLTQPFDVLKTRRQVFVPSANVSPHAPTVTLAMHVVRTEGWRALFAGLTPRCGKVAPACGLMIACYEGVGRYLTGSQED